MKNNIEIYTLDYCPFCKKAKLLLEENNFNYKEIPCEDIEDEMRINLQEKFKLNSPATFPQIVVNGQYIGGYSDLIQKFKDIF